MKVAIAASALALTLFAVGRAEACTPLAIIDPATGETYPAESPRALAEEQASFRQEANAVFIAEVSAIRLVARRNVVFTLTPALALYDTPMPRVSMIERRDRPQTCDRVKLAISDLVVVYAAGEGEAWRVVGIVGLGDFQDRSPEFAQRIRELRRDIIPLPVYSDAEPRQDNVAR